MKCHNLLKTQAVIQDKWKNKMVNKKEKEKKKRYLPSEGGECTSSFIILVTSLSRITASRAQPLCARVISCLMAVRKPCHTQSTPYNSSVWQGRHTHTTHCPSDLKGNPAKEAPKTLQTKIDLKKIKILCMSESHENATVSAAILCPAVCISDFKNKARMCCNSIKYVMSQPFSAQWVGGCWGGVGLGVSNLVSCSNFELKLHKEFQTSHSK